jgi:hypothetical protein
MGGMTGCHLSEQFYPLMYDGKRTSPCLFVHLPHSEISLPPNVSTQPPHAVENSPPRYRIVTGYKIGPLAVASGHVL